MSHALSQRAPSQAVLLRLTVVSLLADLPLPEALELVTGVPAEDLPAHVLVVHPLEEKMPAERSRTPFPGLSRVPTSFTRGTPQPGADPWQWE